MPIDGRTWLEDRLALAATIATPGAPPLQRVAGVGVIGTQVVAGGTRVATLFEEGAARIRLPRSRDAALEAVLINTAGGLTDGDRLRWSIKAAPASRVVVTTPAAERIYRSRGGDAVIETRIDVGSGGRLDWLPQETLLYEGSRLARRIEVELAGDATLLMLEAALLGREAMGESAETARLADIWRIRRDGRLIHAEAGRLGADRRERQNLSLLAGARAFATLLYVGADAEARAAALGALPESPQLGISRIGEKLVVRALASSGIALRRTIVPIIAVLSARGQAPRLWLI